MAATDPPPASGVWRTLLAPVLATALCLSLFILVYAPALMLVSMLRLTVNLEPPVIIAVTAAIATVLIALFARLWRVSPATFGLRGSTWRYVIGAIVIAIPLSALFAWGATRVSEAGPLAGLSLPVWLVTVYFILGAPAQEELIFRGLLQTVFARTLARAPRLQAISGVAASVAVGVLFGAIHLAVGPLTAAGALVLGLLAGELRRRSGSLIPAIVCHAIFNLGGILWT